MLTQNLKQNKPKPFLKWAGGKSQLIQQYLPYFPKNFQTYYEPFLGGGAVYFYLQPLVANAYRLTTSVKQPPKMAILTDVNPELINAYCCVRDNLDELIVLLEKYQHNHNKEYYYKIRSIKEGDAVERAARLIYLNKTCFNGLYRENLKGEFNVPLGKYKNPKICHFDLLSAASVALQNTQIEVSSFETILNYAKTSSDFVYFDPPYYPLSSTSNFTAYSRYSFNESEQVKLKNVFVELANRSVKVMLSNSDSPFIKELYKDFNTYKILASRAINSNVKQRGKIFELLITSY